MVTHFIQLTPLYIPRSFSFHHTPHSLVIVDIILVVNQSNQIHIYTYELMEHKRDLCTFSCYILVVSNK